ncbi:MAG: cation-transporting P-type ATPase, partial [Inquilinus sp.]|nr:cation-transporting P-type ATPase [Inquilinus sp.]
TREGAGVGLGVGDPMEIALLTAGAKAGLDRAALLRDLPEHREEAFDPQAKLMATWHRAGADGFLVAVKGAPEAVLARSATVLGEAGPEPLDSAGRDAWQRRNRALAGQGLRVLGLARKSADRDDAAPYDGLTLVGLVGLLDPPRGDVAGAVAACLQAGIRVVMATGDQAPTARAIAGAVGFPKDAVAVEGGMLKPPGEMTEAGRQSLLATDIFARVSPEQKLDLVDLYQQAGQVVAMTGDGVNDAPALKKADIGIAMGLRGSQVAREAADMVLRDDAFPSIVAAVEQGRIIFGNIRKMVLYLLSCNLSEILVVSVAAVGGLPLPLLPLQILYLNLVTDVFPAFALGAGEGEAGAMRQPPRDPRENVLARRHWAAIVGHGAVIAAATLGSFGLALGWLGHDEATAVTMSFLTLALAQLWHVFNMRDRGSGAFANEVTRNPYVWGALALCIALIAAAMRVPVLAEVLRLVPLDATAWSVVVGFSVLPLLVGQTGKLIRWTAA